LKSLEETLEKFFNFHDPVARGRILRYFWIISLIMLVLGYILVVLFLFR
jgi:hypothetical protein